MNFSFEFDCSWKINLSITKVLYYTYFRGSALFWGSGGKTVGHDDFKI